VGDRGPWPWAAGERATCCRGRDGGWWRARALRECGGRARCWVWASAQRLGRWAGRAPAQAAGHACGWGMRRDTVLGKRLHSWEWVAGALGRAAEMGQGRGATCLAWAAGRALLAAPGTRGRLAGARSRHGPARGKVELGRGERKGVWAA
jgi:hypothetical protein